MSGRLASTEKNLTKTKSETPCERPQSPHKADNIAEFSRYQAKSCSYWPSKLYAPINPTPALNVLGQKVISSLNQITQLDDVEGEVFGCGRREIVMTMNWKTWTPTIAAMILGWHRCKDGEGCAEPP